MSSNHPLEISWFGALCDDDYEFLGVPNSELESSWDHCKNIVLTAEEQGFDNILLPSGYQLGIDGVSFAAAIATITKKIRLLLAVRTGEFWAPQLARQIATIDHMAQGRLDINIISSDLPGETVSSPERYRRTTEYMQVVRQLLEGKEIEHQGEFIDLKIGPPRVRTVSGHCPNYYFGGFSEEAKNVAAAEADVFLTWPDTVSEVSKTVEDMKLRASAVGRELKYGLRSHVIVRETEEEARQAARQLVSKLEEEVGEKIRNRSLDASSRGVSRQIELREGSDEEGFAEKGLWTGIGRARSGAGAAIVGNSDQVIEKISEYQQAGIDAFIFSGYPHITECERFGQLVLPKLAHQPLAQN